MEDKMSKHIHSNFRDRSTKKLGWIAKEYLKKQ